MATNPGEFEVLFQARKAHDLETHVRKITVDGSVFFELRDYIPSLNEYGRGYCMPPGTSMEISKALADAEV